MAAQTVILDELLDPLGRCLTADVARRVLAMRASPTAQARIDELAAKSTAGTLTRDEQTEYETYVSAGNFIAVLQSKARKMLQEQGAP